MATAPLVDWKLPTAPPAVPLCSIPASGHVAQSVTAVVPNAPQAEWAAEAIVNLRNVVAGVTWALVIEGVVALCIVATWNLWHIR